MKNFCEDRCECNKKQCSRCNDAHHICRIVKTGSGDIFLFDRQPSVSYRAKYNKKYDV